MRIGVLGGSFDPPHRGHLAMAKVALEQLELDEVVFVPANRNPLKDRPVSASGKQRLSMVAAMIADEPQMSVSDMELTRGGLSYAIDTIQELQMVRPGEYRSKRLGSPCRGRERTCRSHRDARRRCELNRN